MFQFNSKFGFKGKGEFQPVSPMGDTQPPPEAGPIAEASPYQFRYGELIQFTVLGLNCWTDVIFVPDEVWL